MSVCYPETMKTLLALGLVICFSGCSLLSGTPSAEDAGRVVAGFAAAQSAYQAACSPPPKGAEKACEDMGNALKVLAGAVQAIAQK